MMGCLRRLGCLVTIVVLGAAAFLTRDIWWPRINGDADRARLTWSEIDPGKAEPARVRLQELRERGGPPMVALTPGEAGALLLDAARGRIPSSIEVTEIGVEGDELHLRGTADLSALRGLDGLSGLSDLLTRRQSVDIVGRPRGTEGGGEFSVEQVRVAGLPIPDRVVGALLGRLDREKVVEREATTDGPRSRVITFPLPAGVSDIRVGRGQILLYKQTP